MTSGKGRGAGTIPSKHSRECCMCGDYGLPHELFRCKVCQFRSQHRYCSNEYPKAESYRVCNWCLTQKGDDKAQNSCRNNSDPDDIKTKKGLKEKRGTLQLQLNGLIKKRQRSPENTPAPAAGKRVMRSGGLEDSLLRRSKSEETSNSGIITKQVFRNKVRRYKLLDEVSSQ
ncbi:hypothetical protein LguiA_006468 [Lonicera macranthoides]